jgi:hypothetical protein
MKKMILDTFTIAAIDRWGRPIRYLDVTALTICCSGAALGTLLVVYYDFVVCGAKIATRLVAG